jgi:hypothetical protein
VFAECPQNLIDLVEPECRFGGFELHDKALADVHEIGKFLLGQPGASSSIANKVRYNKVPIGNRKPLHEVILCQTDEQINDNIPIGNNVSTTTNPGLIVARLPVLTPRSDDGIVVVVARRRAWRCDSNCGT